jgi:hypothetical protein
MFVKAVPKQMFFDRAEVLRYMDAKTLRAFSRFGAFTRTRAKSSMGHKTKTISLPGRPPHRHGNDLLNKLIFFALDALRRSVVIGPVLFRNRLGNSGAQTLEEGGIVAVTRHGKTRLLHYKARPYMQPAFEKELPNATAGFAY